LEPEAAALLAAKILAISEPALRDRIREAQAQQRTRLLEADTALQ
jgi:phosphoribosylcarboxyaminoimidazole (NCAIR) mutase